MTQHEKEAQEIFNKAIRYLREMPAPAADKLGHCMYRSPNGPCLVGLFLTDKQAKMADNGAMPVSELVFKNFCPKNIIKHQQLFKNLQEVHDNGNYWNDKGFARPDVIQDIATKFNLTIPE